MSEEFSAAKALGSSYVWPQELIDKHEAAMQALTKEHDRQHAKQMAARGECTEEKAYEWLSTMSKMRSAGASRKEIKAYSKQFELF